MKKYLTIFLTAAMITMLFTGCGGTSSAAASGSSAPEEEKTETSEAPAREEKDTKAAPDVGETETAEASAQEEKGSAEASAQDEEKSAAQTGFRLLSETSTDAEGRLTSKYTYYEDNGLDSMIVYFPWTGEYQIYLFDREYDDEGKWVCAKNYTVHGITDIEGVNLDDYKTEEYMTSTSVSKYEDNGSAVEESDLSGNLISKSTYNSQGQVILAENYKDGEKTSTTEYTYNEQGVLVKSVYDDDETVMEYTSFGVTKLSTSYQSKEKKTGDINYTYTIELHYDDNGILTDGEMFENGEVTETYTYVLDEYGNILNYSVFDKDGNLARTVENEIVPIYE
ncbi:MAG: hypothetical protein Q4D81_10805 [Eubacteriales bacterium]|nr:hypothetical protein [Eubacteriales bacterium]